MIRNGCTTTKLQKPAREREGEINVSETYHLVHPIHEADMLTFNGDMTTCGLLLTNAAVLALVVQISIINNQRALLHLFLVFVFLAIECDWLSVLEPAYHVVLVHNFAAQGHSLALQAFLVLQRFQDAQ